MPTLDVTNLGKFLQAELKLYDRNFYSLPEDELWGALGLYVPSTGDLPLGVEEIDSYRRTTIGRAALTDGRAYDIPLVDFGIKGSKAKTMMVIAGAEWSFIDLERAKISNANALTPKYQLVQAKSDAIKTACDRRIHELVYAGEPGINFYGLFNNPNLSVIDESASAVFSMTPAQLYDWWQSVISSFKLTSKLAYSSIIAYVSDDLYTASTRRFTDGTGDSPYLLLTNSTRGRFLKDIQPITELSSATLAAIGIVTDANKGLMVLGDFSDRSVKRHFYPLNRTEPFPKDTGVHFGITGFAATSEVDFKVPERFAYVKYNATPAP